jgi:hypothetical protein
MAGRFPLWECSADNFRSKIMSYWLDRYIAEQRQFSALTYGDPNIIEQAAEAIELFSEDELEAFAATRRETNG